MTNVGKIDFGPWSLSLSPC